jgi:hypothetical protein
MCKTCRVAASFNKTLQQIAKSVAIFAKAKTRALFVNS